MNTARRALAERILRAGRAHDADEPDRLRRLRNVEAETAELLAVLVRGKPAAEVLELGTSNGYSTLWLADAAESVGGRVTSVELDPQRSASAREHLEEAGLDAELRVEDAARALSESPDAAWDFIFLDAERPAYSAYWPELVRTLRPSGLLAIDNVLSHPDEVRDVTELIEREPAVATALIPIGAGVRLVVKARA